MKGKTKKIGQLIFWLLAAMATATAQELKPPTVTYDSVWYTYESLNYYEHRYTTYDDGSVKTLETYVGNTEGQLAKRAAGENEAETDALARAVRVVLQAANTLKVAGQRSQAVVDLAPDYSTRSKSAVFAVLGTQTWDSSEGTVNFIFESGELSWEISGVGSGSVLAYGSKAVRLSDFPTTGTNTALYNVSDRIWSNLDGSVTIEKN